VKVERHGAVAVLRLDDPSAMNALSPAIKAGLQENVPRLLGDAAVRTIILTGTGKAFCAGGDIRAMQDPQGRKAPAVRARMQARHADVLWPVEYRTVAADDGWLSPMYRRDTVSISIHQDAALPCDDFFADIEPIFREHGGRPHWGKIHNLGARELAPLYPMWERFLEVRRRLDPNGVFLNDHLRGLFGV